MPSRYTYAGTPMLRATRRPTTRWPRGRQPDDAPAAEVAATAEALDLPQLT
jgi:hypothetical protein